MKTLGARVALASGTGRYRGHVALMHRKAVLIDDRVLYSGSANVTCASRQNRELVFCILDTAVVHRAREALVESIATSVPLLG